MTKESYFVAFRISKEEKKLLEAKAKELEVDMTAITKYAIYNSFIKLTSPKEYFKKEVFR